MTAKPLFCSLIVIILSACSLLSESDIDPSTSANPDFSRLLNHKINPAQRRAIMSGEQPDWSDIDSHEIFQLQPVLKTHRD